VYLQLPVIAHFDKHPVDLAVVGVQDGLPVLLDELSSAVDVSGGQGMVKRLIDQVALCKPDAGAVIVVSAS